MAWHAHRGQTLVLLVYLSSRGLSGASQHQGPFQPGVDPLQPGHCLSAREPAELENRYKNAVFYTDQLLEQMLTQLQLQGLMIRPSSWSPPTTVREFNETQSNSWGYDSNALDLSGAGPPGAGLA